MLALCASLPCLKLLAVSSLPRPPLLRLSFAALAHPSPPLSRITLLGFAFFGVWPLLGAALGTQAQL